MRTLCIGNETQDTDDKTTKLAQENNSINHGLVSSTEIDLTVTGYWHTSLADVEYTAMLQLAKKFDNVYFFDQDDKGDKTLKLYRELKSNMSVQCETAGMFNVLSNKQIYWHQQFKTNPSICVKPFVANNNGDICNAITSPITQKEHETIKQNMIAGVINPQCGICYAQEGNPIGFQSRKPKWGDLNSSRISESLDWIDLLDLQTVDDLFKINRPYYYRITSTNLNSIPEKYLVDNTTFICVTDNNPAETSKFNEFLKRCIHKKTTDFILSFSTNTLDINKSLLTILDNFSQVNIVIKLDAVGKVNDYIHWSSSFDAVLKTIDQLVSAGHRISFFSKVSIYNILVLNELLEFFDSNFSHTNITMGIDINANVTSPYNFPDKKRIIDVLDKCKETNTYKNVQTIKSTVDNLYKRYFVSHYQKYNSKQSIEQLDLFFKYSDSIDKARGSKLENYIPELDVIRRFI